MKSNKSKVVIEDEEELSSEELNVNESEKNNLINRIKQENIRCMKDKNLSKEDRLKFLLKQTDMYAHFLMSRQTATESEENRRNRSKHREKKGVVDDSDKNFSTTRLYYQPSVLVGGQLKNYQLDGLNWMISLYESRLNGILADEMGLGKTIQTISLLAFLKQYKGKNGYFMIIVPKSTMPNWNRELKKWCPTLNMIMLNPVKEEREESLKLIAKQKFEVIVTSYEGINICMSTLKKINWEAVVIDEAHRIKNEHALLSKNVRLLNSKFRLLVTGTPLQNNLHELWALLNFLLPDLFSSSEDFDEWFGGNQRGVEGESIEQVEERNAELVQKLHKILKPFLLRRTKNEVEKTLPPKKEIHIKVGLTEMQKDIYKKLLKKSMDSETKLAYKNIIMQLRKCCNHPYLFEGVEDYSLPDLGEHLVKNSSKMRILEKLLEKLLKQKNQVLIFSQMTRVLDILEDYLNYKEIEYCRIDGNTTLEDRELQIAEFTKPNSEIVVFLLSTRAGGLGINLMTANTVVLYDSDWNPQVDLQAMDRVHRIGQTKTCIIYRLICENTIEEKIIERQAMRLKLDSLVIQQGRISKGENFSKEQMKDMIQYGADAIFKAGDDFKDEEIDAILEKGEKLTTDFYEKAEKDAKSKVDLLLNFNFNASSNVDLYMFEDEDYLKKRQEYGDAILASKEYDEFRLQNSKRDRNLKLSNLNFDQQIDSILNQNKAVKKKYRAAKVPYHHLYENRERLIELKQKQINSMVDAGLKLPEKFEEDFNAPEELTPEEFEEMKRIANTGFPNWEKKEYDILIANIEKNGLNNINTAETIAAEIETKSLEELNAYLCAFWTRAKDLPDGIRILRNIEKRNKAAQQKDLSQKLIEFKIANCKADCWEKVIIQYPANSNRYTEFSNDEDQFIVWLTSQHGYGSWDKIIKEIRLSDEFMFNYYLKTRDAGEINKRIDYLVKILVREFQNNPAAAHIVSGLTAASTPAPVNNVGGKEGEKDTSVMEVDDATPTIAEKAKKEKEKGSKDSEMDIDEYNP